MKSATLTKILYSSLALSCLDSQLLCAMDIPMNGAKRTASEAGFEQSNQAPKRLCLKIPTELSELPIHEVIENASKDEGCRNYLIEKIYNGLICPESLGINLKDLLRLNSLKIAIETLTPFELHIICSYNPDNILNTDAGKVLIIDLQNKAQHDSSAQNTLAILYKEGLPGILEQNLDMALKLYNRAASNGYAEAQCNLAIMYNNDKNVPQDYPKALEWFTKAANQGLALAQNSLGFMYSKGNGVPQDYAKAVEWHTKAAIQGSAPAQNNLGFMYDEGLGVPQDDAKALEWYTKAANQGFAPAQHNLGFMYKNGEGIPQDYAKAVEWYTKAANQGFPPAQNHLGFMYDEGLGVPQDDAKALEWYTKAANQGFPPAQYNLAFMHDEGQGIPQDDAKALEWYTKAANQGFAAAQNNLGLMYKNGEGVTQDYAKALEWYTKAANQGLAPAQYNLGFMYKNGEGVTQDYAKALEWYTKAATQGNVNAQNFIKCIISKKNDPLLVNPMDINALTAKMTPEIENFDFALKVALGETILGEEKNNPTGNHNTRGNNPGMAIPSLYSDFQCCPEYALKIRNILNHLAYDESMDKGFLITNLELNPNFNDLGLLKQQLEKSTTCLRLTPNPTNPFSYLSFGDSSSDYNFKYSKLFQEILDENNPEYLKMKEAVKSLEEIYELNLRENKSKALTVQYSSFSNRESLENAQNEIKLLNEIIEKNKVMLFCLKTLNGCREKLIEVIQNSTPLRNLAFSKNPLMKHF